MLLDRRPEWWNSEMGRLYRDYLTTKRRRLIESLVGIDPHNAAGIARVQGQLEFLDFLVSEACRTEFIDHEKRP